MHFMNTTLLCGTSAFFLHRIPPCVWELVAGPSGLASRHPSLSTRAGRRRLKHHAAYLGYVPLPLYELVRTRDERHAVRHVEQHLAGSLAPLLDGAVGEEPPGGGPGGEGPGVRATDIGAALPGSPRARAGSPGPARLAGPASGFGASDAPGGHGGSAGGLIGPVGIAPGLAVTPPLLTLFTLAEHLPVEQLCMAMYEFCGTFSVLRLLPEHRAALQRRLDAGDTLRAGGWEPVLTRGRALTDLWRRPPLVTVERLRHLAAATAGIRGHKRFARAASAVFGVAASPLEVQTALRLGAPRGMGGEGIGPVELNHPIKLSPQARSIASRTWCSADLCIGPLGSGSSRGLVIECQSRLIHDDPDSLLSDSDRTTALQSMGYTVALVTRRQVRDPDVYRSLRSYVAHELGIRLRPKTPGLLERERQLCWSLFMDWTRLGL